MLCFDSVHKVASIIGTILAPASRWNWGKTSAQKARCLSNAYGQPTDAIDFKTEKLSFSY